MKRSGFTLIELLTVIAIIGILSGIAVVVYIGSVSRSTNASIKAGVEDLTGAMVSYTTANSLQAPYLYNTTAPNPTDPGPKSVDDSTTTIYEPFTGANYPETLRGIFTKYTGNIYYPINKTNKCASYQTGTEVGYCYYRNDNSWRIFGKLVIGEEIGSTSYLYFAGVNGQLGYLLNASFDTFNKLDPLFNSSVVK